jgi:putative ABC transport system permease protein
MKWLNVTIPIALAALKANKLRTGLTVLGVVIGIGTIIGMLSLINGINESVTSELRRLGPNVIYITREEPGIHVGPRRRDSKRITLEEVEELGRRCELVGSMTIASEERTRVEYRGQKSSMVTVRGVQADYADVSKIEIDEGRFFEDLEGRKARVCILGSNVVEALFGRTSPLGREVFVGGRKFTVLASVEPSGMVFGSSFDDAVIIPYEWFTAFFGAGREDYVMALPAKGVDVEDAIEEIRLKLRIIRRIPLGEEDSFAISTQESLMDTFNKLTASIYWVMRIVASIALIVSGVGIMNIMLVVVMERTREIGLRKAVGAPRIAILGQFVVEAIVLTLVGGLIGIGLGFLIRVLVASLTPLPASVPIWAVPFSVAICCAIGIFFGFYPALKASGLNPVEALHYE